MVVVEKFGVLCGGEVQKKGGFGDEVVIDPLAFT